MSKKSDKQVVQDEADAEVRETARQAAAKEQQRVIEAAAKARAEASAAADADTARETFGQALKRLLGW